MNIRLKILGENHPDVAACYNNVGKAYYGLKDYANAEINLRKAIEMGGKTDADKSGAARYHFNLGLVLFAQKKYEEAMAEYRQSEALYKKTDEKLLESPHGKELLENMKKCESAIKEKSEKH